MVVIKGSSRWFETRVVRISALCPVLRNLVHLHSISAKGVRSFTAPKDKICIINERLLATYKGRFEIWVRERLVGSGFCQVVLAVT